jgi:hypothetical protein
MVVSNQDTTLQKSVNEQLRWKKIKNKNMGRQNQYLQNGSGKTDFSLISCVCKEICLKFNNALSLTKVRFKMWFHGKNIPLNAKFISDNILIK